MDWQQQLRDSITSTEKLLISVGLEDQKTNDLSGLKGNTFPVRVTQSFINRMEMNNPGDPLLLQVLPRAEETICMPGYSKDPVGERHCLQSDYPGVLHKYHGRVLLVATAACAIHCRYCFRKAFPYQDHHAGHQHWEKAFHYIARDQSVSEVILSGGDPLMLSDEKLAWLYENIQQIPHIKRLRIHTRIPVVLPDRMTSELLESLSSGRLKVIVVIHSNHPNEINEETGTKILKLKNAGIELFNQSVLLKGINDNSEDIIGLSEALFEYGIVPYYLHCLDKVEGAAHLEVEEKRVKAIMHDLRSKLPGYLVPRLVREVAGEPYKMPVL